MELKPEGLSSFFITDADVANVLNKPVEMSQQQLARIASIMDRDFTSKFDNFFWDAFDEALEEASLQVLYPEDNL